MFYELFQMEVSRLVYDSPMDGVANLNRHKFLSQFLDFFHLGVDSYLKFTASRQIICIGRSD